MYSAAILDHFDKPRNAGELQPPAVAVEASNPVCGDILRLSLLVEEGKISQVAFKAKGCVAAIAAGSALTEIVKGTSLEDAARLSPDMVAAKLGGLPPGSSHAADLAIEALRTALRKTAFP
jgi:NifU-like protein involved in Fe-S cluster formation